MRTLSDDEALDVYGVVYGNVDPSTKPKRNKRKVGTGVSNIDNEPELELTNTATGRVQYFETYTDLYKYLKKIKYLDISYGYFMSNIADYLLLGHKDEVQHTYKINFTDETNKIIEDSCVNLPKPMIKSSYKKKVK